jgi:hypothetical protein
MNPRRIKNGTRMIKKTSQAFTCALQVRRCAPNVVVRTRSAATPKVGALLPGSLPDQAARGPDGRG